MARRRAAITSAVTVFLVAIGDPTHAQTMANLRDLSIDELADIDVSSVSKATQALADAPAAIFVISHDDIVRSGATTLPEILRLAPNLYVAQQSASKYTITARGLSGNQQAQNFSNKLLVLIDGRSVYTPLYSGVYWDMQDVLPDDIDRIEVISGPGATLWGANAVNGVINIITRSAGETQGLLATADGGARERSGGLRYGGRLNDTLTARLYVRGLDEDETFSTSGAPLKDDWWRVPGGFRLDWAPADRDALTLQGDIANSRSDALTGSDELTRSRNLLARWTRTDARGGAFQLQAYIDHEGRRTENGGGGFGIDTYDLYFQHNDATAARGDFVWGGGVRLSRFDIDGVASFFFEPAQRTLLLANAFAQYGWAITGRAKLTVGIKLEKDPYTGLSFLPDIRLSWKPADALLLWGAVSRAVRSATPFDRDVVEKLGNIVFLTGSDNFHTEKVTAFETGTRIQAGPRASLSISAYYNLYDDLKGIQTTAVTFLPLYWNNSIEGHSYGTDAWAEISLARWWKLTAGLSLLHKDFRFRKGVSQILGMAQMGDDPPRQALIKSAFNLGKVSLDLAMRYVGPLPDPAIPAYWELGGRIGWRLSERFELSLSGANLLHPWHQEFPAETEIRVPRRISAGLKWRT